MTLLVALCALGCSRQVVAPPVVRHSGVQVTLGAAEVRAETPIRALDRGGMSVVLVGVVHVADLAYYDALGEVLASCPVVLQEGLAPESDAPEVPDPVDLGPLLAQHDLAQQGLALPPGPSWETTDLSVASVRAALIEAGASPALAAEWLDDRDQNALVQLLSRPTGDDRGLALARFALLRGLTDAPTDGPEADLYWNVVIGSRDRVVVERIATIAEEGSTEKVCILYGANHIADIEAKLLHRGWSSALSALSDESWPAAITVSLEQLQLGVTQVQQLLGSERGRR